MGPLGLAVLGTCMSSNSHICEAEGKFMTNSSMQILKGCRDVHMNALFNCRFESDARKLIDLNFGTQRFGITLHFLLKSLHIFSGVSSPGFGLLLGYPA